MVLYMVRCLVLNIVRCMFLCMVRCMVQCMVRCTAGLLFVLRLSETFKRNERHAVGYIVHQ